MSRPAPPLPTRDGVGPSCVALPAGPFDTVLQCLVARFAAVGLCEWRRRMKAGEVVDEHGTPVGEASRHRAGLRVYYYRSLAHEPRLPFEPTVLHRDPYLVVADKPHFLAVTPGGRHLQETLLVRLKRALQIDTLAPVHRIDRETAGLVIFSVEPRSRGAYQRLFAERRIDKRYECIAPWRPDLPTERSSRLADDPTHFMRVIEVPGAPNSRTALHLIERNGRWARYGLVPETGRRHQLRVHCAALGIPIEGDRIYPRLRPVDTDDWTHPLRLWARSVAFDDPLTGEPRVFESRLGLDWPAHQ